MHSKSNYFIFSLVLFSFSFSVDIASPHLKHQYSDEDFSQGVSPSRSDEGFAWMERHVEY